MPTENKKLKVVIDTNVFISGLNFIKNESEILDLFKKGEIEVYVSFFILKEIERILREKFKWEEGKIQRILIKIKKRTILVEPIIKVSVIKEKDDDNRILECALEAKANFIISGDKKDILPLKEFNGIKIVSSKDFLNKVVKSKINK